MKFLHQLFFLIFLDLSDYMLFAGINFKRDNKKMFTGGKHISSSNLFESFAALHCRGEKPEKTFKKFNAEQAIYC